MFLKNDDQFLIIADVTYRETYSGQKKRNRIKPFLVCASDGTIIDIYGPINATVNDAKILSQVQVTDI